MTITLDRQVELQGLLMGPGTVYAIEQFNPWTWPDLASNDLGRPQRHGIVTGRDLMRGRRIVLAINIVAGTKEAALTALRALNVAWQPTAETVPFIWRAGARTYRAYGRPRLCDPDPGKIPAGVIRVECRFQATDPFIYDNTEQTDDTPIATPSDFYVDEYTETYEDGLLYGRVPINNEGNVDAPWTAEITGPWVNPTIQLLAADDAFPAIAETLDLTLTLANGEVLSIDTDRELFHIDGLVRLDKSTSDINWFAIPPGNWALRFTGDSGGGTAEAWARSTWL